MRVISGKYRGKKLACFDYDDEAVRPTLDRVKETLFNMIQFDVQGSRCLDLFGGSGSLGIECISRGASEVIFCDVNPRCVKLIKSNLESLNLDVMPTVLSAGWMDALSATRHKKMDFIFVDPPYNSNLYYDVLKRISDLNCLEEDGTVICEFPVEMTLPESVGKLFKVKERKTGHIMLAFYEKALKEIDE